MEITRLNYGKQLTNNGKEKSKSSGRTRIVCRAGKSKGPDKKNNKEDKQKSSKEQTFCF